MNHAGYLYMPIVAPGELIKKVKRELELPEFGHVDALVGVGLSGAMAIPIVAQALGLRMCIVRKADDTSTHSYVRHEGNMETGDRWAFVDDLICSGKTLDYCIKMMNRDEYEGAFKFAGAMMYSCGENRFPHDPEIADIRERFKTLQY